MKRKSKQIKPRNVVVKEMRLNTKPGVHKSKADYDRRKEKKVKYDDEDHYSGH